MSASITLAGEGQIALKQSQKKSLIITKFIFANVPGLVTEAPVDRAAGKPPAGQIVHTYEIPEGNSGFVNPNQIVYSAQLGSDIGDWDFNWVGLEDADGLLFAVSYVPLQQKRRNIPPLQIGNNVTRNFLVAFDGAQALTGVKIDASTWQHDFTVRLAGIDERQRQINGDVYGRACFFGAGFKIDWVNDSFQMNPGGAYIAGIRVVRSTPLKIEPPSYPTVAWLDVALKRELNDVVASYTIVFEADRTDYTDSAGVGHYCVPLAEIPNASIALDMRVVEPIDASLITYLAARNGDYPRLRARGTKKEDVGLSNVPNAISDDPGTNSSQIIASTAALNKLQQQVGDSMTGMVAAFDMTSAPPGWLKCNGAAISRTTYAKLFAVIGTRYGAGDGVNTFNLRDMRGKFIRAWSDGGTLDAGRALGSEQANQNRSHTHAASTSGAGAHGHGGHIDAAGWHGHSAWTAGAGEGNTQILMGNQGINVGGNLAGSVMGSSSGGAFWREFGSAHAAHTHAVGINGDGVHSHGLNIYAAGDHIHGVTVAADGIHESRPDNVAFLVCIKY